MYCDFYSFSKKTDLFCILFCPFIVTVIVNVMNKKQQVYTVSVDYIFSPVEHEKSHVVFNMTIKIMNVLFITNSIFLNKNTF